MQFFVWFRHKWVNPYYLIRLEQSNLRKFCFFPGPKILVEFSRHLEICIVVELVLISDPSIAVTERGSFAGTASKPFIKLKKCLKVAENFEISSYSNTCYTKFQGTLVFFQNEYAKTTVSNWNICKSCILSQIAPSRYFFPQTDSFPGKFC